MDKNKFAGNYLLVPLFGLLVLRTRYILLCIGLLLLMAGAAYGGVVEMEYEIPMSDTLIAIDQKAPVFIKTAKDGHAKNLDVMSFDDVMAVDDSSVSIQSEDVIIGNDCSGILIRTWTASDASGNTSSTSATMSYGDAEACDNLKLITPTASNKGVLQLLQNQPNPFSQQTTAIFILSHNAIVVTNLFNAKGELILNETRTYSNGEHQYTVAADALGEAGIYYLQMRSMGQIFVKKMVLAKE